MAEVYLGHHTTLNRAMVVKILYAHLSEDVHIRTRFHTEAQAVAALRHPNIVRVFDFDAIDGQPYIVMELIEGITLEAYLQSLWKQSEAMPEEKVLHLTTLLAEALDYAHSEGVLHRDIKPANVMLRRGTRNGNGHASRPTVEPVLTDFGLARIGYATGHTVPGTIMGTPAYMSPEQAQGNVMDARADVYSLGVMVYQMLSGELPFNSDDQTPASILYQQVHTPPPDLPTGNPAMGSVIQKALAKDPKDRYASAGEFAADMHIAHQDPDAVKAKSTKFRLSNRYPIIAIGVAALALLAIASFAGAKLLSSTENAEARSPTSEVVSATQSSIESTPIESTPGTQGGPVDPPAPGTPSPSLPPGPLFPESQPRTALGLDGPDYTDHFDDPDTWTSYDIPDVAAYSIEAGALHGLDYIPDERYTWWSWLGKQSGNVYAETYATNGECAGKDSVGLVVRVDEETSTSGYGFEVSCDGHWRLRRHRLDKSPKELVDWIANNAIYPGSGATNRLGILAFRDQFVLYVNGREVGRYTDPEFARSYGKFAMYVRASLTYNLDATFDDFAFWHIRYYPEELLNGGGQPEGNP